jgi:hypothetical protein
MAFVCGGSDLSSACAVISYRPHVATWWLLILVHRPLLSPVPLSQQSLGISIWISGSCILFNPKKLCVGVCGAYPQSRTLLLIRHKPTDPAFRTPQPLYLWAMADSRGFRRRPEGERAWSRGNDMSHSSIWILVADLPI